MAEGKDPVIRPNGNGTHDRDGSPSARELEQEVDRTRAAMDRTIDAIAGKLTPQQLMMEALGVFREGSSTVATKLVETAREHPVPATIIGLGVAMLLSESRSGGDGAPSRSSVDMLRERGGDVKTVASHGLHRVAGAAASATEGVRESAAETAEALRQKAHDVREQASSVAGHVAERASEVADQVRTRASHVSEQVGERASRVGQSLHESADAVRERAAQVPDQARRHVKDAQLGFWQYMDQRPLAVGAACLAAGLATGLALPETERENRLMGRKRDDLLDEARNMARGVGGEVLEKGKQIARTAVDVAKSEAQRQGLTPAELAQKLQTVTRETEQAVRSEVQSAVPESLRTGTKPTTV
jgi:gas vesicle protein